MIRTFFIPVDNKSKEVEFQELDHVIQEVSDQDGEWTTMECGIDGLGIIAQNQDDDVLAMNRLGIKGDYFFIGMDRTQYGKGVMHRFESLTDEQISEIKISLSLAVYEEIKGW